jgi:hypothetical protein
MTRLEALLVFLLGNESVSSDRPQPGELIVRVVNAA